MVTRLRGNWATLLLPIADDDSIDFGRLRAEIDVLIDARVDGIYSNGTAGEFHNQTEEEYGRVQETLASACTAASMPFVIGACHSDPMVSRQRVARAVALKPRAIQVILPDWWPLTDAEAVDYLALIAEEARGGAAGALQSAACQARPDAARIAVGAVAGANGRGGQAR
ncbi:hypothetical protein CHELA1G11_12601 [Hyphomicrobiales bacterium]|nr:hypothetical protein CHELA1G2_11706 [Hyphomicrobiales bacterium]CAH1665855.1 hypothetical protein CHELA1G11_12601 [Hyphomicrobiales bacterium]